MDKTIVSQVEARRTNESSYVQYPVAADRGISKGLQYLRERGMIGRNTPGRTPPSLPTTPPQSYSDSHSHDTLETPDNGKLSYALREISVLQEEVQAIKSGKGTSFIEKRKPLSNGGDTFPNVHGDMRLPRSPPYVSSDKIRHAYDIISKYNAEREQRSNPGTPSTFQKKECPIPSPHQRSPVASMQAAVLKAKTDLASVRNAASRKSAHAENVHDNTLEEMARPRRLEKQDTPESLLPSISSARSHVTTSSDMTARIEPTRLFDEHYPNDNADLRQGIVNAEKTAEAWRIQLEEERNARRKVEAAAAAEIAKLKAEKEVGTEAAKLRAELAALKEKTDENTKRVESKLHALENASIERKAESPDHDAIVKAQILAAEIAAREKAEREANAELLEKLAAAEKARLQAENEAAEISRKAEEDAAKLMADFERVHRKATEAEAARLKAEKKIADIKRIQQHAVEQEAINVKISEEDAAINNTKKDAAERMRTEEEAEIKAATQEAARVKAEKEATELAERLAAEEAARVKAEKETAELAKRLAEEEEAARVKAEKEAVELAKRLAAEEEAARVKAEKEAAELAKRLVAEKEAAELAKRLAAEKEAAELAKRLAVEEEAARVKAEKEAAELAKRLAAEEEAARVKAEKEAAELAERLAAEEEAARVKAEKEAAELAERLAAEEEAARVKAEKEAAELAKRLAVEEEAARVKAEKEAAKLAERLAAEEEAARVKAEKEAAELAKRLAAEEAGRAKAEEEAARTKAEQDKVEMESEAESLHTELLAACDALEEVKAQFRALQEEAKELEEEKQLVIKIHREESEKQAAKVDLDFSKSNGFDVDRRNSVKDDCKDVSVDDIKHKLLKKMSSSDSVESPREHELKELAEAKRVQVLSDALAKSGLLRSKSQSYKNSLKHSRDSLSGLRDEIRTVKDETAGILRQIATLLKEVEIRYEEIERANESIGQLQGDDEEYYEDYDEPELTPEEIEELELQEKRARTERLKAEAAARKMSQKKSLTKDHPHENDGKSALGDSIVNLNLKHIETVSPDVIKGSDPSHDCQSFPVALKDPSKLRDGEEYDFLKKDYDVPQRKAAQLDCAGVKVDQIKTKFDDDDDSDEDPYEEIGTPPSLLRSSTRPRSFNKDELDVLLENDMNVLESESFFGLYELGDVLGSGAFSTVRQATNKKTGEVVAVKCIDHKCLTSNDEEQLRQEVAVLKVLDHPHVLKYYGFYMEAGSGGGDDLPLLTPQSPLSHYTKKKMYYLVTECVKGGELFNRIVHKTFYSENDARNVMIILTETIAYLHHHRIVHRDLKPENLLLYADDDTSIKIADFGFAERTNGFISLKTQCGTPGYVAPEVLLGQPYGKAVDMWAIGIIMYVLLGGYPPFNHEDDQTTINDEVEFHPEYWDQVSDDAKDLIRKLLRKDPLQRWSADEALKHPWMTLDAEMLSLNLGTNLHMFKRSHGNRRFKAAVKAVIAALRMSRVLATFGIKKKLKFDAPVPVKSNGKVTYPNGAVYKGDLLGDVRHGRGTYESEIEEEYYVGMWENDKRHGTGNCVTETVNYDGEWRHGETFGQGTIHYNDGGSYFGEVIANYTRHGKGRYVSPDGVVSDGQWVNDRFV